MVNEMNNQAKEMHAKFKWVAQNQQKNPLVKAGIETSKILCLDI